MQAICRPKNTLFACSQKNSEKHPHEWHLFKPTGIFAKNTSRFFIFPCFLWWTLTCSKAETAFALHHSNKTFFATKCIRPISEHDFNVCCILLLLFRSFLFVHFYCILDTALVNTNGTLICCFECIRTWFQRYFIYNIYINIAVICLGGRSWLDLFIINLTFI